MRPTDPRRMYEALVRTHSHELYRFALRLCGQPEEAEDLVQESFTEAWRGLAKLTDPRKARAWLFQILRHRFSHAVRRRKRRPEVVGVEESDVASGSRSSAAQTEDRDLLQQALDQLDERYKLPFLMVFMEGLTCQQAADELGLPLGTVLSRIHRARRAMRTQMERSDLHVAVVTGSTETRGLTPIPGGRR